MSNFRIYNETLCPDLWDSAQHLNQKIRMNLLQLANDFYEKTELPSPIVDIYLMGSAANYNWTPDSDVDVHVIIDYAKLRMPQETAFKTVKTAGAQWNAEHNVFIKGHKVEMNLQNAAEQKPYITGIYSLNKDQWLRKPYKMPFNLNRQVLKFQYETMKNYVNNAIQSRDREQMKAAKKYLDAYRQYGLDTYGELSYENIIYKMLRARGIIKQLKDSITQVYDRQLTVNEIGEKNIKKHLPSIGNFGFVNKYNKDRREFNISHLTLDNLKALREKARRMYLDAVARENFNFAKLYESDFDIYSAEIKRRMQYINAPITEDSDPEYNASADFMERRDQELINLALLLKNSGGKGRVPWKTVSASLLKKTWLLFGKYHKVHENAVDKIADQILTNIARLDACTGMMGHTPHNVRDELDDNGITFTDEEWDEWMNSYFTAKDGSWLLSDYGLDPLKRIYGLIFNAKTPEEKLYACDKALNVVHQRGDLAAMFVEGGIVTLQDVTEQGGYDANKKYGDVNREFRMEGFGAGIPETDRLKIKNTDNSVRRWQIRSKDAPKTPKMTDEVVVAIPKFDKPQEVNEKVERMWSAPTVTPTGNRKDLFPTPVEDEIPSPVRKIISMAEEVLDRKSAIKPFFEIEYVEDLIGDIMALEFPSAPSDKISVLVREVVKWLARDYDIRKNGTRIGESLLNEASNGMFQWFKQQLPTWPYYVIKDMFFRRAKTKGDFEEIKKWIEGIRGIYPNIKWKLEKIGLTFNEFSRETQDAIKKREGGKSNPNQVPKDAERHQVQSKLISDRGVSKEPIIVIKKSDGYDLWEGWHRTIQNINQFPNGYKCNAWVGYP